MATDTELADVGRHVFLHIIDAFHGDDDSAEHARVLELPAFVRRRAAAWAHAARRTVGKRRDEKATAATMKARKGREEGDYWAREGPQREFASERTCCCAHISFLIAQTCFSRDRSLPS